MLNLNQNIHDFSLELSLNILSAEEWKRPMNWAGFLDVGAATRLPVTQPASLL